MNDFISNAAKRFAKIIHADTTKFQDLQLLKARFEKELSAFANLSKNIFLDALELELQKLFSDHLNRCQKVETCPQHVTYANANFLISEERKEEKLSTFLTNNENYESHVSHYYDKLKTTSSFLDKEKFIKAEIERIKRIFIKPITITSVTGGTIVSMFDYSKYTQYAYEWLMSGQDWSLEQILKSARNQYLQTNKQIWDDKEFKDAIYGNLKGGVAYVLYEKFLNEQLENKTEVKTSRSIIATNLHIGDNYGQLTQGENISNHTYKKKNIQKDKPKSLMYRILSNPWLITILCGLLIAFLAKQFGWV